MRMTKEESYEKSALVKRINSRLKAKNQKLKATRNGGATIVSLANAGAVIRKSVSIMDLAKTLGVDVLARVRNVTHKSASASIPPSSGAAPASVSRPDPCGGPVGRLGHYPETPEKDTVEDELEMARR